MARMPDMAANKIMVGQGAGNSPVEQDKPGADFFDKFREFIPWVSLDGFNTGGDAGYDVQAQGSILFMKTDPGSGNTAYIESKEVWRNIAATGKKVSLEFIIHRVEFESIWYYLRFVDYAVGAHPPVASHKHIGWRISTSGGWASVYATCGDGTNYTSTFAQSVSMDYKFRRLRMDYVPGTSCQYYIDNVLKVTHTTDHYLPDSDNLRFCIDLQSFHNTALRTLYAGRVLIEKEY